MNGNPENHDRALLETDRAIWSGDPELNLTDDQLGSLVKHFDGFEPAAEPELRVALGRVFQVSMSQAIKERSRKEGGAGPNVTKPSTAVVRDMMQLKKAVEAFDRTIADLDPVTRTWLSHFFRDLRAEDQNGRELRFRDLKKTVNRMNDLLVHAARMSEGISSSGPANITLRNMIDDLAHVWEMFCDKRPISDKGRHRSRAPFLELCQDIAKIIHARLEERGGRLSTLILSGLVDDVLKERTRRALTETREKSS